MTQAINQDLGTRMDVCAIWHRAVHLAYWVWRTVVWHSRTIS